MTSNLLTDVRLSRVSRGRESGGVLPFDSMGASVPGKNSTIGERIAYALAEEGRKIGPTELQAGFTRGHLGRIIKGERGTATVDINRMRVLADLLHVTAPWLILGEGPMRREGRARTPAEEAMAFARQAGCREDAWLAAWERNKDREAEMTAMDWALAINNEAIRLDRSGVKRPEIAAEERQSIQRAKRKLERAKDRAVERAKANETAVVRGSRRASGV